MKIKSLTCNSCGSSEVRIAFPDAWTDKDLKIEDDNLLGHCDGHILPLSKLKWFLDSEVDNGDLQIICECSSCREEGDVSVELEDGRTYTPNNTYTDKNGNYVNTIEKVLLDITQDVSIDYLLFDVGEDQTVEEMCERWELTYKKGCGFYQVTKTESVKEKKEIIVQRNSDGVLIYGQDAKDAIGVSGDFKIEPKKYPDYTIFVQSTSNNRVLKVMTSFIYKMVEE